MIRDITKKFSTNIQKGQEKAQLQQKAQQQAFVNKLLSERQAQGKK